MKQRPMLTLEDCKKIVAAAKRHHVDCGQPEIGRHRDLRHGDHVRFDHRVMDITARQHLGERMADQFADAQLALGRT